MRYIVGIVLSVLYIFGVENQTNGARILAIMHLPSYSHQIVFRPLWRKLVERGHELVLITTNSMLDTNATNYREIILKSASNNYNVNYVQMRLNRVSFMSYLGNDFAYMLLKFSNHLFDYPEVRKLYDNNSKEKFDLVMVQMLYSPSLFAFAHRFNASIIGLSSLGLTTIDTQMLGGLVMASHEATWEMESNVGPDLPFWKRLKNFYTMWYLIYTIHRHIYPLHQKIAEEHMDVPLPPMIDIAKNISLVFINENPVMTYGGPKLPNIIRFHSLHVSGETKPLPQDLKNFVDSATDGFIYFSVGTTARFSDVPNDIQQIFYDVFAKLPYKIVWKNEGKLLRKSDNIYVSSWYPQSRILAHSNIKLFMYQGGSQSTQEAIHHAVPVLGFPILSDQEFILSKLKSLGVGNHLNLEDLTTDMLKSTILEIIRNKEYKRNMIELRRLVNDTPYNLLDNLVWWTEYVIRNRDMPHFRNTLIHQPWYQHVDMDIVAFLTVMAFIVFFVGLWISIKLLAYACKQWQEATSRKRKTD